jgi:hypothetical protein
MKWNPSVRVFSNVMLVVAALATVVNISYGSTEDARNQQYHLVKKVLLGGDGGWDYFTVDPATHHIFIGRGTYVMVLDQDGKNIGKIEVGKDNEAHAVAFAPDLHRAFTSNGGGSSVTIFNSETYRLVGGVKLPDRDTDDILYEPVTKRVFTFNGGKGHDATAIDAQKATVLGNIPLGGKPETAQADGQGHIYVNIEDKSELKEIDAATLTVRNTWPLAPCKNPSGMAIDTAHSLLVIGCHNNLMEFWDYGKNKVAGTVPIPPGVDANRFDPQTGLAFASCGAGDGTITVAHQDSADKFSVVQTITTMKGARTMALDTANHRIYTVSAEFGPPPAATAQNPRPWPTIKSETFTLFIFTQ